MLWSMHILNVAAEFRSASRELMQNDTIYEPLSRGKMVLPPIGINFVGGVHGYQRLDDINHIIRLGGGQKGTYAQGGIGRGLCVCV